MTTCKVEGVEWGENEVALLMAEPSDWVAADLLGRSVGSVANKRYAEERGLGVFDAHAPEPRRRRRGTRRRWTEVEDQVLHLESSDSMAAAMLGRTVAAVSSRRTELWRQVGWRLPDGVGE